MPQNNIYTIILVLFFSATVFGQGDPCKHLLDPNRNGSIVLPDGKSWCDVARETGSAYAKCRCEHGKNAADDKAKKQTEIDNMYAQRDVLQDKANEAKLNAYQINLTNDNPNFKNDKQAKIAYLEEYIRYNEQTIGLLKEMNQRFQIENITKYMEQDVQHKRAEINRLKEKEQSKTLKTNGASDEKNTTDQISSLQNNQESIYAKKQREAEQAQRAEKAQAQRQLEANQRQYQQTMDNKKQAKEYIRETFNSGNVSQEEEAQNFYNNLAKWESRKDYDFIERKKKADRLYALLIGRIINNKFEKARETAEELSNEKYLSTLGPTQEMDFNTLKAIAYLGDPNLTSEINMQEGRLAASKTLYNIDATVKNIYRSRLVALWETTVIDFENKNFERLINNYYKIYWLTGDPVYLSLNLYGYSETEDWENYKAVLKELKEYNTDIVLTRYYLEHKRKGTKVFLFNEKHQIEYMNNHKAYINPTSEKTTIVTLKEINEQLGSIQAFIDSTKNGKN